MRPRRSVSLVVPAHNEEKSVGHLLELATDALTHHADDLEILIVDDASTDATAPIVASRAEKDPRVRLLRHESNRGLGAALRTGFAAATREWILYTDCDLPWDLEEMGRVFRAAEVTGADFISGYRHDRTGEGLLRTLYSFIYNGLIHLLFGVLIRDINFACKLLRRRILDGMELKSEGSFIDAELVARAIARGVRIQQIGLDYFPRTRGVSTLSSLKTIRQILTELLRLAPEIWRERRASRRGSRVPGSGSDSRLET